MLQVQSLVAGYGALTVLHDVSLSVGDREAVAIVGANGAGKSTLVRAICCCVRNRVASSRTAPISAEHRRTTSYNIGSPSCWKTVACSAS
jgi:ABC-type branched-subunit amino acid transport system ATPase component